MENLDTIFELKETILTKNGNSLCKLENYTQNGWEYFYVYLNKESFLLNYTSKKEYDWAIEAWGIIPQKEKRKIKIIPFEVWDLKNNIKISYDALMLGLEGHIYSYYCGNIYRGDSDFIEAWSKMGEGLKTLGLATEKIISSNFVGEYRANDYCKVEILCSKECLKSFIQGFYTSHLN